MPDGTAPSITVTPTYTIARLTHPMENGDYAIIDILWSDGRRVDFTVTRPKYDAMLYATQNVVDPVVEATLLLPDGVTPDVVRLMRFRLSHWVAANLLPTGAQATAT